jgi:serine/threonine-protein kinase
MMILPDGQVGVIDFNAFNQGHGDPWWEFDSIPWGTEPPAYFYTGMIRGYFGGEPPAGFFRLL